MPVPSGTGLYIRYLSVGLMLGLYQEQHYFGLAGWDILI